MGPESAPVKVHARVLPLERMIELYQQRFSGADIASVLMAMVYFDDAERDPPAKMIWSVTWKEVRKSVTAWVRKIAR